MPSEPSRKLTLGRLEKVDLRTYWHEEAAEFTPWLAQVENIKLLGESIGIALEVVPQEQMSVSADILCRDVDSDRWVLIENQLEPTDPTHLGRLLTAMAELQAATVIWIASSFTPEHQAALNWLNHMTQEEFRFFGLEIELWQIGKSALAPKFNLIVQPHTQRQSVVKEERLTESQRRQLEFWSGMCEQLERRGSIVKPGEPSVESIMSFAIGRAGFRLYTRVDEADACLAVGLLLSSEDAKPYFHLLEEDRQAIEDEMGTALEWEPQTDDLGYSIACVLAEADLAEREQWTAYYQWLCAYLEQFHEVFADRVKRLNANDYQPLPDYSFNPLKDPAILPSSQA
ncbi:MAG TPA: DUF4268 domain-containing protein [Coleofasciculaceae cyanobacterium]